MTSIYNQMMRGIHDAFNNAGNSDLSLQKAIFQAKDELVRIGDVTLTEAHEISEFIKHDINEAAEFMMESSEEFCDWLMLDIEVVERKVIDMFLSVADKTRNQIEQLSKHH